MKQKEGFLSFDQCAFIFESVGTRFWSGLDMKIEFVGLDWWKRRTILPFPTHALPAYYVWRSQRNLCFLSNRNATTRSLSGRIIYIRCRFARALSMIASREGRGGNRWNEFIYTRRAPMPRVHAHFYYRLNFKLFDPSFFSFLLFDIITRIACYCNWLETFLK